MFKLVIVAILVIIVASLALAMVFMIRDRGRSLRPVRALTLRIGLSLLVFVLLFVGYFTGAIKPHGIYPLQGPEAGAASDQNQ
jgi:uncharacterized membrane protein